MLAARLSEPGSISDLHVVELPVPAPPEGWVRLKVMAFGLNRSEYHSVHGMAEGMTFPRILGIEASGVIDLDPEGILAPGTQAVTMMGGMGRVFDGGYAQYVIVPRTQIITFRSSLPWEVIGSVPETLQTAYGSLTTGLDLQPGQSLLVRGGTSALGLATAALAADMGCRVYATSRREAGLEPLRSEAPSRSWTTERSLRSCARQSRVGFTPSLSWLACRRCGTRWRRRRFTERSASPGCCLTRGRSLTSTRWTGSPTGYV